MTQAARATARLDVWLWRARFFKKRSEAAVFAGKGKVRITRAGATARVRKAGLAVAAGDVLTFSRGDRLVSVRVTDVGARRGSAREAHALFDVLEGGG